MMSSVSVCPAVSFSAMAQKKNITPCEVTELVLDEGKWIITTNKGQYIFDAETLSILSEN